MKKLLWQIMIVLLMAVSPSWGGFSLGFLPVEAGPVQNDLSYMGGSITVESIVYSMQNLYVYAYQIIDSDVDVSWFSVMVPDGATVVSTGKDTATEGVVPNSWNYVGAIVQADFGPIAIPAGEMSTYLYFFSPDAPITGSGAAMSTGGGYLVGSLYTPIPEPATLGLLSIGALLVFRKHRCA